MASNFQIATTLGALSSGALDSILSTQSGDVDPDWSFQPYAQSIRLGNGKTKGQGFPIAKWRWNGMEDVNREVFKAFVGSNLSTDIYIKTATNETLSGLVTFKRYLCVMNWPQADEDFQADKVLSFILTFTHMVYQP